MRHIGIAAACILQLGLLSCAGTYSAQLAAEVPDRQEQVKGSLPPLSRLHSGSGYIETNLNGSQTMMTSGNTVVNGTSLDLAAPVGGVCWAAWELPAVDELRYLDLKLSIPLGSEAYLGLANYLRGSWELIGPVNSRRVLLLDSAQHSSAWDTLSVAVITHDGHRATVDSLALVARHDNIAPSAELDATPLSGNAPLLVEFDASASSDLEAGITRYQWDFNGDGLFEAASYTPLAMHTYTTPGIYQATVAVEDSEGAVDTASIDLDISSGTPVNLPPSAELQVTPTYGDAGLLATLDAGGSTDPDGQLVLFEYDFDGDGLFDSYGTQSAIQHTYNNPGVYRVACRITDEAGAQAVATAEVRINIMLDYTTPWQAFGRDRQCTRRSPFYGPQTSNLKWTFTISAGGEQTWSSPAIGSDGTIYIGSMDHHLYAIHADGSQRWAYPTGWTVESAPAIGPNGTIYASTRDRYDPDKENVLYAINPDGTLKWTYHAAGQIADQMIVGASGAVFFGCGDGALYAIRPNGTVLWSYQTGADWVRSPAIGSDGTLYVSGSDYHLYAINPDGTLKWNCDVGDAVLEPAIGADGTLYMASFYGTVYAVSPSGTVLWSFNTDGPCQASPALAADGTIYIGTLNNSLYALTPAGGMKWRYTANNWIYSAPAIGADGTVYFGSLDYNVYALASDGTFMWSYATGFYVETSPAVDANGTLYIVSDDGKLYAFGP